jgi:tRNA(fMet)-specific endonuclease VapC
MSVGELYYGVYKSSKPEENARILEIFLLSINVIFPDMDIMKEFGELKYYLYHKNLLLTDADILIAATCLSKSAKLVTGNLTHFKRFPGLILDNWAK